MKKSFNTILVIVLLMVSMRGQANGFSNLHIYEVGDGKFKVEVSNIRGRATAFIKDQDTKVLFERKVRGEDILNLTFDLSEIESGNYVFVMEDEYKRQIVPFTLDKESVEIHLERMDRLNFPQLIKNDDKVILKFLAGGKKHLNIDIKDKYGEVLFHDEIEGIVGLAGKQFQFQPGDYLVTMSCEDYSTTEYLSF